MLNLSYKINFILNGYEYKVIGFFCLDGELVTDYTHEQVLLTNILTGYSFVKHGLGSNATQIFERKLESEYFVKLDSYSPEFGGSMYG